jgi:hypothetical protein
MSAMGAVKNYWSMMISTYNKDFGKVLEKSPDLFINWMKKTTDIIEKSNTDPTSKLYTKGGVLWAMGDEMNKVLEKSPELAAKYKDVAGSLAWDLLQNSNRLSEDAAKKAALEDFFGKSKGGK